jgi:hypothetical protein
MRGSIALIAAVLLLGGCALTRDAQATRCPSSRRLLPQGAADDIDFVQVGGITYYAGYRAPAGRGLRAGDLGPQIAVVHCKLADHMVEGPDQRLDGDAAYLDPGTPLHAVNGYRPGFRLAARREGQLVLFEAAENPSARTWGDLLDLEGKVHRIAVNDRNLRQLAHIRNRTRVTRLLELVLRSPLGTARACPDRGTVVLAFHLDDGTATTLAYNLPSRRLDCRDPLPRAFGATLGAALGSG